ncbi:hypothetical protein [Streptomyces sp. NPDC127103]|uniref:hypothetical protein n=1 Tax=Streptomyces sp. NPDC127103 TaxID=3347139 RepID=UPI00365805F8
MSSTPGTPPRPTTAPAAPSRPATPPAEPSRASAPRVSPDSAVASAPAAPLGTGGSPRPETAPSAPAAPAPAGGPATAVPGRPASGPSAPAPGAPWQPAPPAPSRPAPATLPRPAAGPTAARQPAPTGPAPAPARPTPRPTNPAPAAAPSAPAAPATHAGLAPGHAAGPHHARPHTSPFGHVHGHGAHRAAPAALPPETPFETTTRLRPVRERRTGRAIAVGVCAVLGIGLIGGALTGMWLAAAEPGEPAEPAGYTQAKDLWHNAPVDSLFPRTLAGPGAGPGGAARTWTRIVVAPDAACSPAVLAKGLLATLQPLGCERVLRATYTDATASSVITVGLVFTRADATTQRTLGQGLTTRLGQDVPPALSGPGTIAARFGAKQRAGWWLNAPTDLPVVVTAVSGFADGRAVDAPQPADRAMTAGRTDATAQSGLGHEAKNITLRFERLLRTAVAPPKKDKEKDSR